MPEHVRYRFGEQVVFRPEGRVEAAMGEAARAVTAATPIRSGPSVRIAAASRSTFSRVFALLLAVVAHGV